MNNSVHRVINDFVRDAEIYSISINKYVPRLTPDTPTNLILTPVFDMFAQAVKRDEANSKP
jgi:hypothetical protein